MFFQNSNVTRVSVFDKILTLYYGEFKDQMLLNILFQPPKKS